jgi:flagellar biosynthesis protein
MPSARSTQDGSGIAASRDEGAAKNSVAVALQSDPDKPGSVPRVVATGRGEFAEIILDIAFKNGVKVRQDTDLAEILATVDLDSEIPVEAIIAVAEILRYVYAANKTGSHESDGPAPPIL